MTMRRLDLALTLSFAAALVAPTVDSLVRPEARLALSLEMRRAAPLPAWKWNLTSALAFPQRYEAWYGDVLGLRDLLLCAHSALAMFVFDTSPTTQVVLGKDRWLYLTDMRAIDIARGVHPFSQGELEAWRRALESRRDWCAKRGIEFVYAFAPDKTQIYPEFQADRYDVVGPTRLDQLVEHLRKHSSLELLDLRPALVAEKRNDRPGDFVYYPYGSHWSERGGFAAYEAILDRLRTRFPTLQAIARDRLHFADLADASDSWTSRMYLGTFLPQHCPSIVGIDGARAHVNTAPSAAWDEPQMVCDDPSLPRLLVYHDSFGDQLRRFLPENFSETTFIWQNGFDPKAMEEARPDAVLQIYTERLLGSGVPMILPSESGSLAESFARAQRVLFKLDTQAAKPALEPHEGTRITRLSDGLDVATTSPFDMVLLPAFEIPEDANLVLSIDVESPRTDYLDIFYKTKRDPEYRRANAYRLDLDPGQNQKLVEMLDPSITGRLLLHIGLEPGHFVVRALEIRAVPR